MAYDGNTQTSPLTLPRTIDPGASLIEINPLPPPGIQSNATARLHPHRDGHYPAVVHELDVQLGGTITNLQVWTATVTVIRTSQGLAAAAAFTPVVLSVIVNVTATAAALGIQFTTAALAASSMSVPTDVNTVTRLGEICTVSDDGAGDVKFLAVAAGLEFTVDWTTEASGTAVETPIADAAKAALRVGIFVVRDGVAEDGITPIVRLPVSGDTSETIYGVVAVGNRTQPIDPEVGYTFLTYKDGRTVPVIPKEGTFTAMTELAVAAHGDLWVRVAATGAEVAGASTSTPGVQVNTITPTPVNATVYSGFVQVTDGDGAIVATSPFNYTSDADALDTEIVTGITADLTGSAVDAFLTLGGTTTLTLTPDAGFTALLISTGVGVLAPVLDPTAPTHVKLGARFTRATAAGVGEVDFGL